MPISPGPMSIDFCKDNISKEKMDMQMRISIANQLFLFVYPFYHAFEVRPYS